MASELRVDKIIPSSGTSIGIGTTSGTINFLGTSQINTTGVVTASSFSGSGANLTSLPAANLTGTLPAISAANLTSIPAANVTGTLPAISGANLTSLPAANLTGTLPAISGANLTGISGGIAEADIWRINSNFQGNSNPITANWERADDAGMDKVGTGMSQSSGVFTFPSTGVYDLKFCINIYAGNKCASATAMIRTAVDGSNFSYFCDSACHLYIDSGNCYNNAIAGMQFKVTDTSTHKVQFGVGINNSYNYTYVMGSGSRNYTWVQFIKLADI
tara:strand:+ start:43 stop:867 length:825 start_codon:yes stop_codon:yes gene_type:complete